MQKRQPHQHALLQRERLPEVLSTIEECGDPAAEQVDFLVAECQANLNYSGAVGETPLMATALAGAARDIPLFLAHGADPALLSTNGSSALSAAAFGSSPLIVKMLLHHGNQETALQHGLERLLQTAHAGLEAHRVSVYGSVPVHKLCELGDHFEHVMRQHHSRQVVAYLTHWFAQRMAPAQATAAGNAEAAPASSGSSAGSSSSSMHADTGAGGPEGHLHQAASAQWTLRPSELTPVSDGGVPAHIDYPEFESVGSDALMRAAHDNRMDMVRRLLGTGRCNVASFGYDGSTALHFAALKGHTGVLQLLLSAGWDVNARTFADDTPVILTTREGHAQAMRALIDAGADVNAHNTSTATALCKAAELGHCEMLTMLLDAGADINSNVCLSGTALLHATRPHHLAAVQLLLDRGADPNLPDVCGLTPLYWAIEVQAPRSIIKALKQAGGKMSFADSVLQKAMTEARASMDFQAIASDVMCALIPDSKRQEFLADIAAAEQTAKGRARSGRGRSSGIAAARAAAGDGGSSAAAGASSQPERSREEADRVAAQLLAEEEGERAKALAAQAKKAKRARQKAQARAVEVTVADEEAATAEREQRELQQEGLDAGASSSNGAAAAVPATNAGVCAAVAVLDTRQPLPFAPTADAAVQQLPGLSLQPIGSAPAPAVALLHQPASSNQPSQPAAPTAQQQQPRSTQGTSTTAAYEDDERLCVVCMEGQRCMVLVPCGHVVMCQECCAAVEAASNECPMCRTAIVVAVALNL